MRLGEALEVCPWLHCVSPRMERYKEGLRVLTQAVMEAEVSSLFGDELLESMGVQGLSKSEVSRICKELDDAVQDFKNRPLVGTYPYLWLDATFPKVREGGKSSEDGIGHCHRRARHW